MQYGQETLASGIGEPGGLGLPIAALTALQTGEIIDIDPITGITTKVADTGQDYSGRNLVVIQSANQAYSADMTYDAR
ncbi:MAG: hypothetical protein QHH00_08475, partial [Methanomassiliicoccales archaeon]|nr:hypothetical protein [Methanomassiliicoccales archaeon]